MVIYLQRNATREQIKEALAKMKRAKKRRKGYPDLDGFFGTLAVRDFVKIQNLMRDEWWAAL